MKNFWGQFIVIVLFLVCVIGVIFPCPFLEGNFTKTQWQQINDNLETETTSTVYQPQTFSALLDWNNSVNTMFTPFENTRIFDITTKKIFTVQRTGGVGHADIEPLTIADTQIFNEITKTAKSQRLPVLVELKGVWVSASLATKPHGYSLITDNGFSGHLCLHFFGSKTHTTHKTDYLHQKTVKTAHKLSRKIYPKF